MTILVDDKEYPFEDYVNAVVASEVGNSHIEVCKAQAIAARTFGYRYVLSGKSISSSSSVAQAFRVSRMNNPSYPNAIAGTKATEGLILTYEGQPLDTTAYSASNGGRTTSSKSRWGGYRAYLLEYDDQWDYAMTQGKKTGHGVGMSQVGAKYAASIGKTYQEILQFYYPSTAITRVYGEIGESVVAGIPVYRYLDELNKIKNKKPTYLLGHDGSDGKCDCIGLSIGSIRNSGGTWKGTHGTNYAIRYETTDRSYVSRAEELSLGDIVYKGRAPSSAKYDLPSKYRKGGANDTGDYIDYYHVGTVTQVNPLRITHMTSPTVKVDTSLGAWHYRGRFKKLDYTKLINDSTNNNEGSPTIMNAICKAKVVKVNGYLNLRATDNTKGTDIGDIPIDSVIYIYEKSTATPMWRTVYNGVSGWVHSNYLEELPLESADTGKVGIFIPLDYDICSKVLEGLKASEILGQ